jgi:hypothetical protein
VMNDNGTPQNKGWFGRKKSPVAPPQKVSRPPSASAFVPYKKKSRVPEVNATDDELPPREDLPKRTGSPGSPPPQTEKGKETQETPDNGDAKEPTPTVPLHAGFDFAAIKDVLRESKDTGGKPSALSLNPVPEHLIPSVSPITRSGSAPPYMSKRAPPSHSQLSRNLVRGDDADEDGVSGALTPTFPRSADMPSTGKNNGFTSLDIMGPEVPTKSPPPSNSPSLSFGGYDGSIWQALSNDEHQYQSGAAVSTPSLSPLGEGGANGSYGYLSSSPTINPFAGQSSLSFGGPGGTIDYTPSTSIVPPSNNEAGPWSSPLTRGKKPITGLNSNPWA